MPLRVVAISAPHIRSGHVGPAALSSCDPASLFNACRVAGDLAGRPSNPWSDSNWAGSRRSRRSKLLLMHSFEEQLDEFEALLQREQPNLLLIGAMTLCLPGAVACAELARRYLGDRVCIVLGGRHPTESVYLDSSGAAVHHASSPLLLMAKGRIPEVFDIVVSGEAEAAIPEIGNSVARLVDSGRSPVEIDAILGDISKAPGSWLAGSTKQERIHVVQSLGVPLRRESLASPARAFGVTAEFNVFEGRLTAHAFSDSGPGCPYDCLFCSERRSVAGSPSNASDAHRRLMSQFIAIEEVVREDHPGRRASAFVEDSVFLSGRRDQMRSLASALTRTPTDLRFGAQLTIDLVLQRREDLGALKRTGLDYVFVGLETGEPQSIGGISKDVGGNRPWMDRAAEACTSLSEMGIECGAAVLFGLGESRAQRRQLFEAVDGLRRSCGNPSLVSLNWAVQHPLRGRDGGADYEYVEWGTGEGELGELLRGYFGEASDRYPLVASSRPALEEVREVCAIYDSIYG